jgi:hypothetical protein
MYELDGNYSIEFDETAIVTEQDALEWLSQVDGTVYRNRAADRIDANSWVAVVRTPSTSGRGSALILAFGETLTDATCGAEEQWQALWSGLSLVH